MKLAHLGDLHLGRSLGDFDLIQDQKYILDQILEILRQEKVEGVLIAGDVYDRATPSEEATVLLDYFLSKLTEIGVKVFIVSGNHDSDDRLNFGSSLFRSNQIYIASGYDGTLQKEIIRDAYGDVNIYMLPFVKAAQVRYFYPEAVISNYEDAVRVILENAKIDPNDRNIIIAHQFVTGRGADPMFGGSESAGTRNVGTVEKIGYELFEDFDYTALGHIHSGQQVGKENIRYSGSPLKYSLNEIGNAKSMPIITLGEKGDIQIETVPLTPLRDMIPLKGRLEELLAGKTSVESEDFVHVTLTNEDFIQDALGIFRQIYPNTLKVEYENSGNRDIGHVDISDIAEKKSFKELITDFYRLVYGMEIKDEEMKYLQEAAKEAGIINETN